MPAAILDASVYIDYWEGRLSEAAWAQVQRTFIIRHSSVVLSELRRGARTRQAQRLVDALFKLARVQWAPSASDWWKAGRLIRKIGDARDVVKTLPQRSGAALRRSRACANSGRSGWFAAPSFNCWRASSYRFNRMSAIAYPNRAAASRGSAWIAWT